MHGKTIMVVGPPGSGKSTFLRYLQFGIFQHEQEHQTTRRPVESARFDLTLGSQQSLRVAIKKVVDIPGQEADPAEYIFGQRPHALAVVLNCGTIADQDVSVAWLKDFVQRLDQYWQGQSAKKNRLRSMVVIMNKVDKLQDSTAVARERLLRKTIDTHFKAARGRGLTNVIFKRCVMVETKDGTKWIDAVLVDLASAMHGKA
jgi:GTPase Era involved in 16S rRNA processing